MTLDIEAIEAIERRAALQDLAFGHLSHAEMASKVRMLMRKDLDHEAVCTGARDRILWLDAARADLVAALGGLIALYAPSDEQRLPPEHPWSIARAALIRAGGVA